MKVHKDPLLKNYDTNPGGDCYWVGGKPKFLVWLPHVSGSRVGVAFCGKENDQRWATSENVLSDSPVFTLSWHMPL